MADARTAAKRQAWREGVDFGAPLTGQLPEPHMRPWQVAFIMSVAESSVYDSCKRYDAAVRRGDHAAASREVPCVLLGTSHRVPTQAFLDWWYSAGQSTLRLLAQAAEQPSRGAA
jgi:hypothetical protein